MATGLFYWNFSEANWDKAEGKSFTVTSFSAGLSTIQVVSGGEKLLIENKNMYKVGDRFRILASAACSVNGAKADVIEITKINISGGELTPKAKDMISVLQYQAFKADLVKAAEEELAEVKETK